MAEPISYLHLQARPTPEIRAGLSLATGAGAPQGLGSGQTQGQGQDGFGGMGMVGYDSGMGQGSTSSGYDRSIRHGAMDQAGPSGSMAGGGGVGWIPAINGGYGNAHQEAMMPQGNGMTTDYMSNTGRTMGYLPQGGMSMDGYRGQMGGGNDNNSVLPILPPPDNMAFMSHNHAPLLPIDVPSNQNRMVPLSSPHRSTFNNGPPLSFTNPESSTRMSSSSVLPMPIAPTPVSMRSEGGGSQTSEARRARSPILPTLSSKFPFLNANAGFRDGDSTHQRPSFSEKASPMIMRDAAAHDASRQLPPLDQGSGSGSSNQKSSREKFSLRHMVEPVDEDPLEESDRERESEHEGDVVGHKRLSKRGWSNISPNGCSRLTFRIGATDFAQDDQLPSKKRRLDRGDDEPWDHPFSNQDPLTEEILSEPQAREMFRMCVITASPASLKLTFLFGTQILRRSQHFVPSFGQGYSYL